MITPRATSIQFRIFLHQTKAARGNAPSATTRLPPRGSFSFGAQGRRRARVHTRVQSCGSPVRSSVSPAREPGVRSACLQPRIHVGITIAHTRSVAIKKWKNALRIPVRILGVTHARARTRARERPSGGTGEMMRSHTHTRSPPHVVPYRHETRIYTRTYNARVRTVVARRTPPCQPPVVAVKTKTEIRTSRWEKRRENVREERGENGREIGKKAKRESRGAGF